MWINELRCKHTGCYSTATCRDGYCNLHTRKVGTKNEYSGCKKPKTLEPHGDRLASPL